ncbi:c-type cytochrome [Cesiribacter andamanensis]|uniref:Putative bifunctional cbb3-type cytochrome c oxidase subunit II/cytochrome c n=1 Tax=Cesiribacter andamanensis AMV16 TaxID=1279009 RepID=M7N724_9BACT|nr:cytochrome c [Cesiribacter andamanensis]EMR03036.1 putative bifunctional cbb3-type cytochrome c oxidase subunit II/cytochrome c [Cesiribacter andamanensis AMV16]
MLKKISIYGFSALALGVGLVGCSANDDYPGMEYAPQMYHSVPYEPLSQITDESAGSWLSSRTDEKGEFYNSNGLNPYEMNMRLPAEGTVARNAAAELPFRMPKDSAGSTYYLDQASATLRSPLPASEAVLSQGKVLYTSYCYPCHGESGAGDGPVGQVYKGVANLSGGQVAQATEGHLFYVITHGKGRMWPHDKQISIEDRWKIVRYVQTLQNQGNN